MIIHFEAVICDRGRGGTNLPRGGRRSGRCDKNFARGGHALVNLTDGFIGEGRIRRGANLPPVYVQ